MEGKPSPISSSKKSKTWTKPKCMSIYSKNCKNFKYNQSKKGAEFKLIKVENHLIRMKKTIKNRPQVLMDLSQHLINKHSKIKAISEERWAFRPNRVLRNCIKIKAYKMKKRNNRKSQWVKLKRANLWLWVTIKLTPNNGRRNNTSITHQLAKHSSRRVLALKNSEAILKLLVPVKIRIKWQPKHQKGKFYFFNLMSYLGIMEVSKMKIPINHIQIKNW